MREELVALRTTIKVATAVTVAILGGLLAVAGIVLPLVRA